MYRTNTSLAGGPQQLRSFFRRTRIASGWLRPHDIVCAGVSSSNMTSMNSDLALSTTLAISSPEYAAELKECPGPWRLPLQEPSAAISGWEADEYAKLVESTMCQWNLRGVAQAGASGKLKMVASPGKIYPTNFLAVLLEQLPSVNGIPM